MIESKDRKKEREMSRAGRTMGTIPWTSTHVQKFPKKKKEKGGKGLKRNNTRELPCRAEGWTCPCSDLGARELGALCRNTLESNCQQKKNLESVKKEQLTPCR